MSGSAFAVTHHAFSSGAGRTSDGNGSHASTLKSPSYTKSVSWQHYQKLDTRRGSNSQLETAVKDLGAVVSFKGYYGDLAIVVAKTSYVAEDGTEKRYLPDGTLVLGNTAAEGIRCYGAIQDAQALSEGVVASSRYPKHWLTVGDPAREFTMTQSAPLMVLPDPDEFVVVQVK